MVICDSVSKYVYGALHTDHRYYFDCHSEWCQHAACVGLMDVEK